MWDFTSSLVWRRRHNGGAGGALREGSSDSLSLLAPLFHEEWEFVMSKSSCWKRRVNHHCPAWTQQGWLGHGGNEASTVFIRCLRAQKSGRMWCIHIYEYKSYVPGPWAHPFPTSIGCLGSGHGCPVLKRAVRNVSGAHPPLQSCISALAQTYHTPAQPWALLSQAPPQPQPCPIPSQGLPSQQGPMATAVAIANSGHCFQPGPAYLAGGCAKGLVGEGGHHTSLAAPWLWPCPCRPTFPVELGWSCRRQFFVQPWVTFRLYWSKARFLLTEIQLSIGASF